MIRKNDIVSGETAALVRMLGEEDFRRAAIRALDQMARGTKDLDKSVWEDARKLVASLEIPGAPRLMIVEGYSMFHGTMLVTPYNSDKTMEITGDWLFKPDTKCWYCRGQSYPYEICKILQG